MKAVLAISSLSAGGAERALTELAAYLARQRWEVLLSTFDANPSTVDFYDVHPAVRRCRLINPPSPAGALGKLWANGRRIGALRRLLKAEKPDVVLGFMETTTVKCLLAAWGLDIPVVAAERTDPLMYLPHLPRPWRLARRLLYRRAAAVSAQTESAAAWLRKECHTDVQVIPNGLRALPDASGPRDTLVLSVGRLDAWKGHDVLLRAFARVADTFPEWRLAIVGDGLSRDALRALAESLGIAGRVDWVGRTAEVEAWYARAAVFALASRFEGFPNVLLEAMGMGAAVISTDCRSGPREIISNGKNGLLVPVDDVAALARGLRRLISDPTLRQDLGLRAQDVREAYGEDRVLERWRGLLEAAAATKQRQPQP
jgi:GalNAc-alpha-(1->4)-GalNAc-alpha-(1->3)-diNAcBac-PP-undecaprenol alpha-1,4-N-acetyl-D-galactosaminyltransferase